MNSSPARYCDGETLHSHSVNVQFAPDGSVHLLGEGIDRRFGREEFSISDPLGSVPTFLRIRSGGVVEILALSDQTTAARQVGGLARLTHRLESRASIAAAATVLVTLAAVLCIWQGLPRLAQRAAFAVPTNIETQAGQTAYSIFAQAFPPSRLDFYQRHRVEQQLYRLTKAQPTHVTPRLYFLAMGTPNAFALPGGIIVVADELVNLAVHDEEIAAVLAHELGHIERRHGLQSVLRNSSALIVVSTLTGDLSTLSTFSATLPFLLLQYGYAREFELEADAHAADLLRAAGISPERLADVLSTLDRERPRGGPDFSYLSTHPSTADRIARLRPEVMSAAP